MSRRDRSLKPARARAAAPSRESRGAATTAPPEFGAATTALWITLAVLVLARGALPLVPGMGGWALNLHRFVSPGIGWTLWALSALALIPGVATRLFPWWERMGDAIADRPGLATLVAAAFGAALVWLFPDRVRFVGDFLLRQGTVEMAERPSVLFPQALPLDVLLHYAFRATSPRALGSTRTAPRA